MLAGTRVAVGAPGRAWGAIDSGVRALDVLRSAALSWLGPAFCRAFVVERETRVAWVGAASALAALAAAAIVPLWLIALGPLLLGVPHLVGDVRYLALRPKLYRRRWLFALCGALILAAGLGLGSQVGLFAGVVAVFLARCSWRRRLAVLAGALAIWALAIWAGRMADVAYVHLHNLIGVGLWWAWRARETRRHWLPLAVVALGSGLIMGGAFDALLGATGGLARPASGPDLEQISREVAPFAEGALCGRLVALFAFLQAVHYSVWLRLVPEEDRPRPTPRSYRQSLQALSSDLRPWALAGVVLVMAVLAAWALGDGLAEARTRYLEIAFFHGYLEIVAIALFCCEGRSWLRPSQSAPARLPTPRPCSSRRR